MNLFTVLCLLSAILPSPAAWRLEPKNIFIFPNQIKNPSHNSRIFPFSCSFSDTFPFSLKIIPPQNSKNALFLSKIMKKCVLEIPAARKTPEIIPSGNSIRSYLFAACTRPDFWGKGDRLPEQHDRSGRRGCRGGDCFTRYRSFSMTFSCLPVETVIATGSPSLSGKVARTARSSGTERLPWWRLLHSLPLVQHDAFLPARRNRHCDSESFPIREGGPNSIIVRDGWVELRDFTNGADSFD